MGIAPHILFSCLKSSGLAVEPGGHPTSKENWHAPKRIMTIQNITKNVIPSTEIGYLGDMYLQFDVCTVVGSSCH